MFMVHQSRWGWHPCDYPTFQLLKRLHHACEEARRQVAAWQRWHRKKPHNRVVRHWLCDGQGRRVGCEIVGPRPEPPLSPPFCVRRLVPSFWSEDGRPLAEARLVEDVVFGDLGIVAAYRTARKPAASPEAVRPLSFTLEELQRLAAGLLA
jgi:hypothetical protein